MMEVEDCTFAELADIQFF